MLYDLICGLHGLFRALRAEKWLHKWPFKGEMTGFINIISWYGQWNLMLIKQFKVAEMVFNTLSESWEGWFVVCEGWFWAWEDWYLSTESWFEIYKAWFEVRGALKGTKSCKTQGELLSMHPSRFISSGQQQKTSKHKVRSEFSCQHVINISDANLYP